MVFNKKRIARNRRNHVFRGIDASQIVVHRFTDPFHNRFDKISLRESVLCISLQRLLKNNMT